MDNKTKKFVYLAANVGLAKGLAALAGKDTEMAAKLDEATRGLFDVEAAMMCDHHKSGICAFPKPAVDGLGRPVALPCSPTNCPLPEEYAEATAEYRQEGAKCKK